MITSVYTPDGIVIATLAYDMYYEMEQLGNIDTLLPVHVKGRSHYKIFWGKYAFVYRSMNPYSYDTSLLNELNEYENRNQESIPNITSFVDNIVVIISETNSDVVGYIGGIDSSTPFIYHIQNKTARRINQNERNEILYNCHCIERKEIVTRILREIKIQNGDKWENREGLHIRCDLYSLEKAIELCKFMLHTNFYANNFNTTVYDGQLPYEIIVIQNNNIKIIK